MSVNKNTHNDPGIFSADNAGGTTYIQWKDGNKTYGIWTDGTFDIYKEIGTIEFVNGTNLGPRILVRYKRWNKNEC